MVLLMWYQVILLAHALESLETLPELYLSPEYDLASVPFRLLLSRLTEGILFVQAAKGMRRFHLHQSDPSKVV